MHLTHEQARRLAAVLLVDGEGAEGGAVGSGVGSPRRILTSRVTRWGLTWACIIVLVAWLVSGWFTMKVLATNDQSRNAVTIAAGTLYITRSVVPINPVRWKLSCSFVRHDGWQLWDFWRPRWGRTVLQSPGGIVSMRYLNIPLYFPLLALSLSSAYLWLRYRFPTGYCRKCGYNLSGLNSSPCPECGAKPEVSA